MFLEFGVLFGLPPLSGPATLAAWYALHGAVQFIERTNAAVAHDKSRSSCFTRAKSALSMRTSA